MKLYWSQRSPFVRKVMIVLHETGLTESVECIPTVVAMTTSPNPGVLAHNPLGKIPVLLTEEGPLFDSRVICEYLDLRANATLFPTALGDRMRALRWQALADGMTDILLLWRNELNRQGGPWREVCSGYDTKTRAAMVNLEADAAELATVPFGIGHIAIICALGYLDFRWSGSGWATAFPALADLYGVLKQRPSVQSNQVSDDGAPAQSTPMPLTFFQETH